MSTAPFSVLFVDDDPDSRRIFSIIAEFCQLQSVIVEKAADAYRYLTDHTPDVIILDLHMPETDGYNAGRYIREQGLAATSAIVATTSYYTQDTPQEVAARGFNGYIPKPFDARTLLASLQEAVSNRRLILKKRNGNQ